MSVPLDFPHFPKAKDAEDAIYSDIEAINSAFIRIPVDRLPSGFAINDALSALAGGYCAFCKGCFQHSAVRESSVGRDQSLNSVGLFGFNGIGAEQLREALASSDGHQWAVREAFVPDTLLDKAQHIVDVHDPESTCSHIPEYVHGIAVCHCGTMHGDFSFEDGGDIEWDHQHGKRGKEDLCQILPNKAFPSFEAADLYLLTAVGKDGTLLQRSHFLGNGEEGDDLHATYGCRRMNGPRPCTFRVDLDGEYDANGSARW